MAEVSMVGKYMTRTPGPKFSQDHKTFREENLSVVAEIFLKQFNRGAALYKLIWIITITAACIKHNMKGVML